MVINVSFVSQSLIYSLVSAVFCGGHVSDAVLLSDFAQFILTGFEFSKSMLWCSCQASADYRESQSMLVPAVTDAD